MSNVNTVEGTIQEFTYTTYLCENVGADIPSTMYSDILPKVAHTMMTQLALKKELKEFGDWVRKQLVVSYCRSICKTHLLLPTEVI